MAAVSLAHRTRNAPPLGTTVSHKGVPLVYRHHTPIMVSPHGRHLTILTQREYPSNNGIPINMTSPLFTPACLPYRYFVLITTPPPSTFAIPCNTTTPYQDQRAKFPTPPEQTSLPKVPKPKEHCDFRGPNVHEPNEDLFRLRKPVKTAMSPSASNRGTPPNRPRIFLNWNEASQSPAPEIKVTLPASEPTVPDRSHPGVLLP